MAMNATAGQDYPMMEINTTPLIDVMLVLLIMFILTIPIITHSTGMNVRVGTPQAAPQPQYVQVEIEYDGSIFWNDAPVADLATLERHFRSVAQLDPQPELRVLANKRVRYDTVAKVLAIAQRQGMHRMGFAGIDEFAE